MGSAHHTVSELFFNVYNTFVYTVFIIFEKNAFFNPLVPVLGTLGTNGLTFCISISHVRCIHAIWDEEGTT